MTLDAAAQRALRDAVAAGAELSAARLTESTHDPWSLADVVLSVEESPFADRLTPAASDHYGSHFTFPGGRFLVLFSGKSAYLCATAFTREVQDRVESMAGRDAGAAGELSNILLNPLAGHLAKAWGLRIIISAPRTSVAGPREHLARALAGEGGTARAAAAVLAKLVSPRLFSECQVVVLLEPALLGRVAA